MWLKGLHGAAFLGIPGMVSSVLEMKEWDVNAEDCIGLMALEYLPEDTRRPYGCYYSERISIPTGRTPAMAKRYSHGQLRTGIRQ